MQNFRWSAGIALWTVISGPMIGPPTATVSGVRHHPAAASTRGPHTGMAKSRHQKDVKRTDLDQGQ